MSEYFLVGFREGGASMLQSMKLSDHVNKYVFLTHSTLNELKTELGSHQKLPFDLCTINKEIAI